MHAKKLLFKGTPLDQAEKALIMLHGRGADARDIVGLADHLNVGDFAVVAPEATNFTWYPYSFLVPPQQNEPWLSSAIELISEVVDDLRKHDISDDRIFFAGFSQGACLTLEFIARHARRWGGVVAFTGGLIGDRIYSEQYTGDFKSTPVFIGTGDPDPHVPVERARASADIMRSMNAEVTLKIYPNIGHTITEDELRSANKFVFE